MLEGKDNSNSGKEEEECGECGKQYSYSCVKTFYCSLHKTSCFACKSCFISKRDAHPMPNMKTMCSICKRICTD